MGFIPKYCLINILCLVGKKKENEEIIGEDCEETVKREKRNSLLRGFVNTRIWPERLMKLEGTLEGVPQREGAMRMRRRWSRVCGRAIFCKIWFISMKRKLPRLQINFMRSLLPQM